MCEKLIDLGSAAEMKSMTAFFAPSSANGPPELLECVPWLNLRNPLIADALLDLLLLEKS
ncbi:hypothetical protein SAMN04487914_13934 [Arthrobacter sp. ok909]|uniref:hypothetical protein n=1 Tax=Arthrobacter sp. ok909 TaxID=1761746 RepID=UPI0008895A21|nr:hypothetical protein [Arthrobacter sp. ok909]SDP78504.1 hypothetical protein SAMN04487914_13934 [Arthrobacter sp. ok909]